ncbi:MAG: FAD-dependent oxidoreductase [Pseudomonadota bacterium]
MILKRKIRPTVIIIGANFGGLTAATTLLKQFTVIVIDPTPWFEYLPGIHELVSGVKTPSLLKLSSLKIVRRAGHRFIKDRVVQILPDKNLVIMKNGTSLSYDFCIVAIGGVKNTFGTPGADTHAVSFSNIENCHFIGKQLKILSKAKTTSHIVIVGGGIEGIEVLGEILRKFKNVKQIRIRLIERKNRLLNEIPADIDSEIRKHCRLYPVEFITEASVKKVTKKTIFLTNGKRLKSDLTIWTAGAKPHPLLLLSGFTETADQWAPVSGTLQHVVHKNVFFAGDAADVPDVHSKQAYHAIDMGHCAALNINRIHSGKALQPFKPRPKPIIVSFGDLDTYVIAGDFVLAGSALSSLKEVVFQKVMMDFDPAGIALKGLHLSNRAVRSALPLALSTTFSLSALKRLGKVRLLDKRKEKTKRMRQRKHD